MELYGFKSFADRVRLEFGEGVTALVGPNGSGKSNVVDALRWVFGEQNPRSLRGQRWEEVIFSGSETRRPLGLAEVTVALDGGGLDLPWRELEVTRRVLRSGDSEYLIGRRPCRLKDVLDLAGQIGAAGGGWSYIAQSGVDEILNSRPEDRRAVIEDAAGLARFQLRRQEVSRRLEETGAAMRRLQDVTSELQDQLEPLAAEAAAAERFISLRRDLEDVDAALWADEAARVGRRREAAVRRREALRVTVGQLEEAIVGMRRRLAACRTELDDARKRREDASQLEQEITAEVAETRRELALLDGKLSARTAAVSAASERASRLELRIRQAEGALSAAREAAAAADRDRCSGGDGRSAELAAAEGVLAEVVEQRTQRLGAERDVRRRLAAAEGEHSAAAETVSGLASRITDLHRRVSALESEMSGAGARKESSETAVAEAEARERRLAEILEGLRADLARLREASDGQAAALASLRELQARLAGERAALEERLSALDDPSGKTPLAAAAGARDAALQAGISADGPLAELIEVDSGFERAVQAALGAAVCALTVADFDAAVGLLALRDRALGQDPLAVIPRRGGPAPEEAAAGTADPSPPPGVDWLAAHVWAVPRGAPDDLLIARLLRGWAVAGGLAEAVSLWQTGSGVTAVVTRGGQAITPAGIILDLPAAEPSARVLERSAEMQRTGRRLEEIRSDLDRVSAEIVQRDRETTELLAKERETRAKLESVERSRAAATADARRFAEARGREAARHEDLLAERARLRGEVAGLEARLDAARAAAEMKAGACTRLRAEAEEASRLLREVEDRLEGLRGQVEGLRLAAARAAEEARAEADRLRRLAEERDRLARDSEEAVAEARDGQAELEGLQSEKAQAEARLAELERRRLSLQKAAASAAAALREAEAGLNRAASEADELAAQRDRALRRLRGAEVLVERLQGESKSLEVARGGLADRFAELEPCACTDRDGLLARRTELTDSLAAIGEVCLSAAEQCRRLRERLRYLGGQEADLRASREALSASAAQLDAEMARRFRATFDQCRGRFGQVFAELFSGGHADLVLTDPESPMSSGVEIFAQPPGKRLSGLGLLSGGERALTAVALLFAMAGGSAAGFMVLDEVDAYLDEPNCARFCRYLQRLACERQFVVITHNRATMEIADTLYGLTVEEEGVSRVVSVRLGQAAAVGGEN